MGFRENLKSELTYKDIRVKELAEMTGINKRTLDNYLTENSSAPLAENAVKIASALGVSVEYLVTGLDRPVPPGVRENVLSMMKDLNQLDDEDLAHVQFMIQTIIQARY